MDNIVKDSSFIISKKLNKTSGYDYLLRNGAKLGEVLHKLPSGIVNKTETGIGATSLELKAERNSIIVLPTIQTAKSKGIGKVHYFSSEASTSGKIKTQGKKDFLQDYLKKMDGTYKKFTVVADSLPQLLESLGDSAFQEYFLLLDEIDSIQKDSTFRKRMETCMEFYKMFPKESRAVVSATIIAFTDPMFQDECLTNFKYEKSLKGQITFVETKTFLESATELITKQVGKEKLVVAINEIDSAVTIANYMVEHAYLEYEDISILCGKSPKNKERIAKFNAYDIQNNTYPSKLNFITSAYFTGYDIDESYRLIVLSNPTLNHLRLSEYEIQQIIGRCRKPHSLLSIEVIFTSYVKPSFKEENNIEKLVHFSKKEIAALKCVSNHYESDELGTQKAEKMRSALAENSGFGNFNFVYKNISGEYVTSYLNIDAYVEDQRVKNTVYKNGTYLSNYFQKIGFKTKKVDHYSTLLVIEPNAKKEKLKSQHKEALHFLFSKRNLSPEEIKMYMKTANKFSLGMCDFYLKANELLSRKKIKKYLNDADTNDKLVKLIAAFDAFSLDKSNFVKRNILAEFPKGSTFAPKQFEERVKVLLVTKLKQIEPERYSKSKGKKLIISYIGLKDSTKTQNGKTIKIYSVESHNPFSFSKK
jgi:hypothetical protein